MKIVRVFPRRTSYTPMDDMVYIGDPPLERSAADEVHISCTFTWDKLIAERLILAWQQYYPVVKFGGPAYDDPCINDFTPGLYVRPGVVYTSYGCNNQCPWCLAWKREGPNRSIPIHEGNILQDNNWLQCNREHIEAGLDMLSNQHSVVLAGGIDARLLNQWSADRIRSLRLKQIFLACDTDGAIKPLRRALKLLSLPHNKVRCYVLLRYDPYETRLHALVRLLEVYEAGAIPFAQLYHPPEKKITYSSELARFARTWQRPAGTEAFIKQILSSNNNGAH